MFTFRPPRSVHLWLGGFLLGAISIVFPVTPRVGKATAMHGSARDSVEEFCASEFRGAQNVEQRQELIHFSDARARQLGKIMGGLSPYLFEWEAAPLEVVDSFKVDRVTVAGDAATATITYEVVAQRTSWGGRIKRVPKKVTTIQLQLRLYGDAWKVNDPPFPRVSKNFLSSSYRGIFELPLSWYQNASPKQLMRLRDAIDTILLLDEVK
ncbi:MAG TPA: hypothetical protein VNM47_03610 [Terriglobia bacterium]|nr:hypothetical protein [Terriglobia bacterium]